MRITAPAISTVLLLAACGQTKFEKEVAEEKVALALARETIGGGYGLISTAELAERVAKRRDGKDDFVLIDAMPKSAFVKEHIEGAKNFTFPIPSMDKTLDKPWNEVEIGGKQSEFHALLGSDKERDVIVYCGYVECTRSHNAALWAKKAGFENVVRHPGGIWAWKGAGHPTSSGQ